MYKNCLTECHANLDSNSKGLDVLYKQKSYYKNGVYSSCTLNQSVTFRGTKMAINSNITRSNLAMKEASYGVII
jgi:hypothetical protein